MVPIGQQRRRECPRMLINLWFNLPFGILGICPLPFVRIVSKDAPETTPDHEWIHCWHWVETLGLFPFLYLVEYLVGRAQGLNHGQAYRDISFERDAFIWQGRSEDRPWFFWLRGHFGNV